MKILGITLIVIIGLASCTSIAEKVKKDKAKFIEIGIEESEPVDMNNLDYLYRHALFTNRDKKMEYLDVSSIKTIWQHTSDDPIKMDSIVIFKKEGYLIIYDFQKNAREPGAIKEKGTLSEFEKIDSRLYIGKE